MYRYSLIMKRSVCWILFSYVLIIVQFSQCENTRLRGVSISKQQFYNVDPEWFTCIDGSAKIPFSKVNDDYCDCKDSSDEPGTPACPNGKFHCTNAGHTPIYIPSSRVNDGICDCCDGSDEYKGIGVTKCINDCKELGRADREQRRKDAILQNEGFEVRLTYVRHGQTKQKETEEKFSSKKVELAEVELLKESKEAIKVAAEEPEKKAKEEHENKWNEYLEEKKKKLEEKAATAAFNQMDVDGDGILTTEEIMLVQGFDSDKDGAVSNEEATNVLGQSQVDKAAFVTNLWTEGGFKNTYEEINKQVEEKQEDTEATDAPEPPGVDPDQYPEEDTTGDVAEDIEHDDYDDEDYDEDYEDEDDDVHEDEHLKRSREVLEAAKRRRQKNKQKQSKKEEEQETMPDYNEDTKKLIEIADKARSEFDEANKKYTELNNEISALEKLRSKDFGPEQEFAILQDQCFEFTDREYTYKLCTFENSTQRPKNGGTETSLGTWGEWDGLPGEKYTVMKYSRGKGCWNGPDRSTNVKMSCGKENKILSASEPERCVYQFEFTTPALCTTKVNIEEHDQPLQHGHTEL